MASDRVVAGDCWTARFQNDLRQTSRHPERCRMCELPDATVLSIADGGEAQPEKPWWEDLDDTVLPAHDAS
jgi:hypothetical protein